MITKKKKYINKKKNINLLIFLIGKILGNSFYKINIVFIKKKEIYSISKNYKLNNCNGKILTFNFKNKIFIKEIEEIEVYINKYIYKKKEIFKIISNVINKINKKKEKVIYKLICILISNFKKKISEIKKHTKIKF